MSDSPFRTWNGVEWNEMFPGVQSKAIGGEHSDSAAAAVRLASTFPTPLDALRASSSGRDLLAAGTAEGDGPERCKAQPRPGPGPNWMSPEAHC